MGRRQIRHGNQAIRLTHKGTEEEMERPAMGKQSARRLHDGDRRIQKRFLRHGRKVFPRHRSGDQQKDIAYIQLHIHLYEPVLQPANHRRACRKRRYHPQQPVHIRWQAQALTTSVAAYGTAIPPYPASGKGLVVRSRGMLGASSFHLLRQRSMEYRSHQ